ncbi:MAG: hypothetical protein OEZ29_09225, partial [Candidatus Bathyarchaeota archaeon]|nr:hypothetical protein [Candidatus Bathyarchaeota archaeon]
VRYVEMGPPAAFLKSISKRKAKKVTDRTSFNGVVRLFPFLSSWPPFRGSSIFTKKAVTAMTNIGAIQIR